MHFQMNTIIVINLQRPNTSSHEAKICLFRYILHIVFCPKGLCCRQATVKKIVLDLLYQVSLADHVFRGHPVSFSRHLAVGKTNLRKSWYTQEKDNVGRFDHPWNKDSQLASNFPVAWLHFFCGSPNGSHYRQTGSCHEKISVLLKFVPWTIKGQQSTRNCLQLAACIKYDLMHFSKYCKMILKSVLI